MKNNNLDIEEIELDANLVLGIDLGTRFSCVSVWRNKRFEVICDQFGNRTIPSIVAFYRSAKLVGYNALSMKEVNPANTIYDIKRIIGRRMTDPKIDQVKQLISYEIVSDESKHHNILVQLDSKDSTITHKKIYRPEEICAQILFEIKKMANNYLSQDITKSVITVPAYFNDSQRQATLDAAKIAGLDVLKIINEPTAAALAYGMGSKQWIRKTADSAKNPTGNVIIYDFGAGTLDISLMNICNGNFRVLAVGGSMHIGGEDIDYLIMSHVMTSFKNQHNIQDLKISKLSQLKLKNSAENAKKILSSTDKAVVCVDDFYNGKKLYHVITREFFETMCNELFIMCIRPLHEILTDANISKNEIDDVILVGGSSRIPKIQTLLLDFFAGTQIKNLTMTLNPDEVVSAGASIYGYIMTHQEDPFSNNLVLFDITPLSLGIETLQKQMTIVIPRGSTIPTKKTKVFSTDTDNQNTVSIKIFEGERKLTKNNFHVGTFDLSGFDKGPKGYPTIRITFHIDINGILQVTAHEKRSDVKNTLQITSTWGAKGRLSKNEIDDIITNAKKNEEIDTIYSFKIGLQHKINMICNSILTNLKDDAFTLTTTDKKKIKIDVKNNLKWLQNKELADLPIDELESREKRLSKTYAPLIAQVDKKNNCFKEHAQNNLAANVHDDDDTTDTTDIGNENQSFKIPSDPSDYDKEEIKALKKTISDLGKNILSVVNNPISQFNEEDIIMMTDYIGSVNIWLYTTSASTTIEFVSKINEINKFTEEIMKKYVDKKMFETNNNFTTRDELQLTCLTLNQSIKNNYFSLKKTDTDKLIKKINEIMIWLLSHQSEPELTYKEKLNEISDICNIIYHGSHRMKILETIPQPVDNEIDSDDDADTDTDIAPPVNKIKENIDGLLNKLPDKLIKKNNHQRKKSTDVLLKIDIDKLKPNTTIKYKNIEQYCR